MQSLPKFLGGVLIAASSVFALVPATQANIVITEYDRDDFPKKKLMNYLLNGTVAYLKEHNDEEGIKKLRELFGPNGKGWKELDDEALPICRDLEKEYRSDEKKDPNNKEKKELHTYFESALEAILHRENINVPISLLKGLGEGSRQLIFTQPATTQSTTRPASAPATKPQP